MRLRTVLLLATLFAPALADGAECIGRNPTARTLLIVFGCDRVKTSNVRWFMPKGQYGDQFAAKTQVEFPAPSEIRPIKPRDIPMAFEGGGDCVAGEAMTLGGNCVATYHLPCAAKQFQLSVEVEPPPQQKGSYSYSVLRSIRRKNAPTRCDLKTDGGGGTIYSDSEHITVSVFLNTPETLPLTAKQERVPFYQKVLRLDEIDGTIVDTWESQDGGRPDRVRRPPADNARWLAMRTAQAAGKVTIEVKRVQ